MEKKQTPEQPPLLSLSRSPSCSLYSLSLSLPLRDSTSKPSLRRCLLCTQFPRCRLFGFFFSSTDCTLGSLPSKHSPTRHKSSKFFPSGEDFFRFAPNKRRDVLFLSLSSSFFRQATRWRRPLGLSNSFVRWSFFLPRVLSVCFAFLFFRPTFLRRDPSPDDFKTLLALPRLLFGGLLSPSPGVCTPETLPTYVPRVRNLLPGAPSRSFFRRPRFFFVFFCSLLFSACFFLFFRSLSFSSSGSREKKENSGHNEGGTHEEERGNSRLSSA